MTWLATGAQRTSPSPAFSEPPRKSAAHAGRGALSPGVLQRADAGACADAAGCGTGRRGLLLASAPPLLRLAAGVSVSAGAAVLGAPSMAQAEVAPGRLQTLLAGRKFVDLTAPIFNIPPGRTAFPSWLEGEWRAKQNFAGFVFPTLPKASVMREVDVPGFKTASIIDFADVGKEEVDYELRWRRDGNNQVVEDLPFNLGSSFRAHLAAKVEITEVRYDPDRDPNRLTALITGTKNAERIEIFVNGRASEISGNESDLFFASEYRRQVTFSSRVLQGYNANYQHFKTFQRLSANTVRLNVLTACYLDALNPLYFQTIDKPVVIFSHEVALSRKMP